MGMEGLRTVLGDCVGAPGLAPGDGVRLKFFYPGGEVEILDGLWLGVTNVDFARQGDKPAWVVVSFESRVLWKPLSCLVQIELLSKSTAVGHDATEGGSHYHA